MGSGLGLRSIDERVRLARGEVRVESRPGEGTNVVVRIPAAAVARVDQRRELGGNPVIVARQPHVAFGGRAITVDLRLHHAPPDDGAGGRGGEVDEQRCLLEHRAGSARRLRRAAAGIARYGMPAKPASRSATKCRG